MRPACKAWTALGAYVVTYNLLAPEDEMLSTGADRLLEKRPWLTRAAIAMVAVHVANGVPASVDPVHWAFLAARAVSRHISVKNA